MQGNKAETTKVVLPCKMPENLTSASSRHYVSKLQCRRYMTVYKGNECTFCRQLCQKCFNSLTLKPKNLQILSIQGGRYLLLEACRANREREREREKERARERERERAF